MFCDSCMFKALQVLSGIFSSVSTAFVFLHFTCYALTDALSQIILIELSNRTFQDDENILFLHHPTQQALASPGSGALETWTVMIKTEFQILCDINLNLDLNLNSHVNSYWIDNNSLAPGVFLSALLVPFT